MQHNRFYLLFFITLLLACNKADENVSYGQVNSMAVIVTDTLPKQSILPDSITVSNKRYKVHIGTRGGKYIKRISRNGNEYKDYNIHKYLNQ